MKPRALLVTLALVGACGSDSIGTKLPFDYDINEQLVATAGTAHDDLFRITAYGKTAQDTPFLLHVNYWDGTSVRAVPFSDSVFREGSCGRPTTFTATTKGEIWLASFHVPMCGFGSGPTYDTIIFGRLKADGTWEDHSADFPSSVGTLYQDLKLVGRDGVAWLMLKKASTGSSATAFELYRYAADGTHEQRPVPTGANSLSLYALSADELYYTMADETPYLYTGGAWQMIERPEFNVGIGHISLHGERWSEGGFVDQSRTVTLYRYGNSTFTRVPLMTPETAPLDGNYVPLRLVPRGGGKATWYFYQRSVAIDWPLQVQARDIDGTSISAPREISTASCSGSGDACLPTLANRILLPDGSVLVEGGRFTYLVSIDELE